MELADSIRNRRHCSPEILSDHLHEALHDLDVALRSQPKLFLGPNNNNNNNVLAFQAATSASSRQRSLPSVKTDTSALLEWKSKRVCSTEQSNNKESSGERKVLRPTLSKLAITSLEFSEALPFAAFASLLVELVARLDLVIEEVEELGRLGNFKEFHPGDELDVVICEKPKINNLSPLHNHLPTHGAAD